MGRWGPLRGASWGPMASTLPRRQAHQGTAAQVLHRAGVLQSSGHQEAMNTENPKPEIVEQLNKVVHCIDSNDLVTARELVVEIITAMAGGAPPDEWRKAAFSLKEFELSFRTACRKHN